MSALKPDDGGKPFDFNIRSRRAAETRYQIYGALALGVGVFFLCVLVYSIVVQGYRGFATPKIELEVNIAADKIDPEGRWDAMSETERETAIIGGSGIERFRKLKVWETIVNDAMVARTGVDPSEAKSVAIPLLSESAKIQLRSAVLADPSLLGTTQKMTFLITANVDGYLEGAVLRETREEARSITDAQLDLVDRLVDEGIIAMGFNTSIFTNSHSKNAESAGLAVALVGSLQMMIIVLALALPIGVAASIYLEEFAPKNSLTDLVEVNINNLAAVPSIVFGILGLAVFINYFELPSASAVVGGMVLSLMTLPTIIIATRAALKAVPPSVREAALGVGASKMQTIFHHVLPLAMPGILTGTIIGLAQALGETAPLLMIGMSASILEVPPVLDPLSSATSMPSQIYLWAENDNRTAFAPLTSAAIMVLLGFLAIMNISAVLLRKRFERRW